MGVQLSKVRQLVDINRGNVLKCQGLTDGQNPLKTSDIVFELLQYAVVCFFFVTDMFENILVTCGHNVTLV